MVHPFKLNRQDSALIVVDMQDKLLRAIANWETVLDGCIKMVKFAQTLGVPVVVTEQYPRGLGPTNTGISSLFTEFKPYEKTAFSCFGCADFREQLSRLGVKTVVLVGIEAHICVTQTALDALAAGYQVQVIADAVGSRSIDNKQLGLAKMRQAGAVITGVEIALYEWLEDANSPEFKAILPLIK
ncbi:hydrolase [Sporolituus thermophilus]|uniref:Nicotinamidase-related amidase n=1 Tax=Sporolituus thermophilus DSM 23256 TaxID=1123285 RepID=A0A1G7LK74_9FIRM|nr:hydrolase [Sporolituus thermophilus]SDF49349.1 Nicotinamidase-related amidase [Sporolituus thermophilus DSM 23256]